MKKPLSLIKFLACVFLLIGLVLLSVPGSLYGDGEERGVSFFKTLKPFASRVLHILHIIHIGKWVYDQANEGAKEEEKRKEAQRQWEEQLRRRNEEWDRRERERVRNEYYQECLQREREQAERECSEYSGLNWAGCFATKTLRSKCEY